MTHTCEKCLRTFVRKHNYNKHREICVFTIKSDSEINSDIENSKDLPSYKDLYNFVLNISCKVSRLEKENEDLKNIITNKLMKIKPVNWLNENIKPDLNFDDWYNGFVASEYLFMVFNNDLIVGITSLIENYYKNTKKPPLFSFDNKNKQFFIYRELTWVQLSQHDFDTFIENLSNKFIIEWTKFLTDNQYLITEAKYIDQFNSYQTKIYGNSNNNDNRNNKIRQNLYSKIKHTVSNVQIS